MAESITPENFFEKIKPHQRLISQITYAYCRHPEERKDLLQEITLQLWRSIGHFDGKSKFSTWLYRVSLNVALSFERQRWSKNIVFAEDIEARPSPSVEDNSVLLQQMLARLEPLEKALILLYLEGHDQESIGEILGISETNVSTKIGRIKQKLRDNTK
jgi:RNA polymerase sigma-70 factor (ECF subfamily)